MSERASSPEAESSNPVDRALEMYLEIQNPTIDLREGATAEVAEDWGDFADEDVIDLSQPENQRFLYSPTQILTQALEQSTITPDDPLEGSAAEGVRAWMSNRYQNVANQYREQHPEAEIAADPYQDPEVFARMIKAAQRRRQIRQQRKHLDPESQL